MTASVGHNEARPNQETPTRVPLSSISLDTLISAAAVVLAVLIVTLILTPVGVWRHPAKDAIYHGFDSNLLYISPSGLAASPGGIKVNSNELTVDATAGSHPTVDLLTTPLSFSTSFDAEVVTEAPLTVPLRIELWSPESAAGYFLVFDRDGGNVIRGETIANGSTLQELVGGTITGN